MSDEEEVMPETEYSEGHPEAIFKRLRAQYQAQGYSRDEINAQIRRAANRLAPPMAKGWQKRGAGESADFARLTDVLHRGTFGLTVQEHKALKHLPPTANLRDHLSSEEWSLIALMENLAAALHEERDSQDLNDLLRDATDAAEAGGRIRQVMESVLGRSVVDKQQPPEENSQP